MTQEEARRALAGTWAFSLDGSNVVVTEAALLAEIRMAEGEKEPRQARRSVRSALDHHIQYAAHGFGHA